MNDDTAGADGIGLHWGPGDVDVQSRDGGVYDLDYRGPLRITGLRPLEVIRIMDLMDLGVDDTKIVYVDDDGRGLTPGANGGRSGEGEGVGTGTGTEGGGPAPSSTAACGAGRPCGACGAA